MSTEDLVAEVAAATGAELPTLLDDDSPALRRGESSERAFYLVGLIGGKEVGKSALVNALAGEAISESTSYGPGTETVIAYAHADQADAVRKLLEREAPSRHEVVTHSVAALRRQVLLDLPDIDSIYDDHVELTRRMLRHMLFPIWVQSIEKYADQQPQKLLAAVAAGNDPANFLFVLNKADQAPVEAMQELRADYAARLARTLNRAAAPKVYLVSAIRGGEFDLPELREKLSREKSGEAVKQSIELAGRQRERSMLRWLESQRLPERARRFQRLEEQAQDLAAARLATPLLEDALPRILNDPAHRAAVVDEVMSARVARWPLVNVLHTALSPLTAVWRRNVGTAPTPEALVAASVDLDGRTLSSSIQATFALLQQTNPAIGNLYRQQRLWEQRPADTAAAALRKSLTQSLTQQREAAVKKIARRGFFAPLFRWLLTVGALLWFPIVQPVTELMLQDSLTRTARGIALLVVQLLGVTYLLKSAAFLGIWFLFLWLILRWDTQRRVAKMVGNVEDSGRAVLAWVDELVEPIRVAKRREEALVQRTEVLRSQLGS